MFEDNIISKEFKFPTATSKKKRWYITFKCTKCGHITETVYTQDRFNCICESCKKGKFTTEEFITKAALVHGNRYSYENTNYHGKRTKVTITCKIHGDFLQSPSEHLEGHGCRLCGNEARGDTQKIPLDTWSILLQTKAPHISIKLAIGTGYHNKVTFNCNKHGDFVAQLGAIHSNKHICYECARLAVQEASCRKTLSTPTNLYYVYLPDFKKYKLGISIYDVYKRLTGYHIEVVWQIKGIHSDIARAEYELHKHFKEFQYYGPPLLKKGNTEIYTANLVPNTKILYETLESLNFKFNGAIEEQSSTENHLNGEPLNETIPC